MFDFAKAAAAAQADLATELSSFTDFRKRVDELIRDLKGSPAGPTQVAQEQLARAQFGGGAGAWAEATGLYTAYETVITELENLSKLLSDSMEGMSIAVLASHKGYANIDLDIRDRMTAISAQTTAHYGGAYTPDTPPAQPSDPGTTGTNTPSANDAGGTI
ncbi:hypothetical protein [Streptomyces sp. NPDC018693]|uniref:hypothetical protein n=1 Tax=unclassified Streptomyces TaxID=2593676 RepID=UPI003789B41E